MFSCTRALWNTQEQLTQKFVAPPVENIFELHDKTFRIIGLGKIGSTLSPKAAHLFKKIIGCNPYKSQRYFNRFPVQKVELDELLESSDVISLHCNRTIETTHILNDKAFAQMKKKPVIINTSRGETIDEKAMINALNSGIIHSAGLDVFENEPPTIDQQELLNHHKSICTGHYAWYSDWAAEELQKRAAQNLFHLLNDEQIDDQLN